uniref:Uncharacterized protein n=1 Tax=Nothobranchius kadleci TaxID=1051664 RepID=A0A1A8BRJ1_NOTKA
MCLLAKSFTTGLTSKRFFSYVWTLM